MHRPLMRAAMSEKRSLLPFAATIAGIGLFTLMDAFVKSASLSIGAFSALWLRSLIGLVLIGPVWWFATRRWPAPNVLRVHLVRGLVVSFMAYAFFFALVRLPMAEAIALSFIAPLIALMLAAILLKERIGLPAIFAALLGLAGTFVIVGGRLGREAMTDDALAGLVALAISACLFAWNLVLQRQQALLARPAEVATFQSLVMTAVYTLGLPWLFVMPDRQAMIDVTAGAVLAVGAAMILSWAYARAEAQALVPLEYTGFLWAALFGWLFFAERVTASTVAGAVLIVVACLIATRWRPEQSSV